MNIKLETGDIVWSGKSGGSAGRPYKITIHEKHYIQDKHTGCWCPKEAVEFLESIGIRVNPAKSYSSGLAAAGCWFDGGREEPMSPHVQEAYDLFMHKGNKYRAHVLERFDV